MLWLKMYRAPWKCSGVRENKLWQWRWEGVRNPGASEAIARKKGREAGEIDAGRWKSRCQGPEAREGQAWLQFSRPRSGSSLPALEGKGFDLYPKKK